MEPIFDPKEALRVVKQLRDRGALFAVSHSGGKDSQSMLILVRKLVPAAQIIVVHADLGKVEWPGTLEHAKATSKGLKFFTCRPDPSAPFQDLFGLVRHQKRFPLAMTRRCTSDLKSRPIDQVVSNYAGSHGFSIIVQAIGLRAQESGGRASKPILDVPERGLGATWNKRRGEWYVWHPIHRMSLDEVWRTIREAGQKRHWAYDKGMSRLSCSFCIMSSKPDLIIAARERPDLLKEYVALEKEVDHTVFSRKGTKAEGLGEIDPETGKWKGWTVPVPIREHIGLDPRRTLPMVRSEVPTVKRAPAPSPKRTTSTRRMLPLPVISREDFLRHSSREVTAKEIIRGASTKLPRARTSGGDALLASIREAMRLSRRH